MAADSEVVEDTSWLIARARSLREQGRARHALEVLSRKAEEGASTNADILAEKGACYALEGDAERAMSALKLALGAEKEHRAALEHLGSLYHNRAMPAEACDAFRRAIKAGNLDGKKSLLHTFLYEMQKEAGRDSREALSWDDKFAPAHYNFGVLKWEEGDVDAAIESYERALEAQPNYCEALCNLGVALRHKGRLVDALEVYRKCYWTRPSNSLVRENLAVALSERAVQLQQNGQEQVEAARMHDWALDLAPRQEQCLYNAAVQKADWGRREEAAFLYQTLLSLNNRCGEAWNNLGAIRREQGDFDRAEECFTNAWSASPSSSRPRNNLGVLLTVLGRATEAEDAFISAAKVNPSDAEAYNNLGVLYRDIGDAEKALDAYRSSLSRDPDARAAGQNLLLALNYVMGGESAEVCDAHRNWGTRFEQLHPRFSSPGKSFPGPSPLTVGYISPDLCVHSVSYFAEAALSHHSPERVREIVYSCCSKEDERTKLLRELVEGAPHGTWRDCSSLSEDSLAKQIADDNVDILVELTGHTANNRLGAVARRPAPVQVTWIGYPNSTGLSAVDFRITDDTCDPMGTEQTFVEELVRLDGCFLCYTPPRCDASVGVLPAKERGFVTFGCFNALAKVTDAVLQCWARILASIPGSRLLIKAKPFACSSTRERYLSRLERNQIDSSRVDLVPLMPDTKAHLEVYNSVDVSLDAFPYAGTTTTCESLYMGVPCVTLTGSCHAHNVGASLLKAAGLSDWIANTEDAYVGIATAAAADLGRLEETRGTLRQQLLSSQLCDAPSFVRKLEDAFEWMTNKLSSRRECAAEDGEEAS